MLKFYEHSMYFESDKASASWCNKEFMHYLLSKNNTTVIRITCWRKKRTTCIYLNSKTLATLYTTAKGLDVKTVDTHALVFFLAYHIASSLARIGLVRLEIKCTIYIYVYGAFEYRTRSIIARGLYIFYPVFHCGLYCRVVSMIQDSLCTKQGNSSIFGLKIRGL